MGLLLILVPLAAVVILNLPTGKLLGRFALALAGLVCLAQAAAAGWGEPLVVFSTVFRPESYQIDFLARVMVLSTALVGLSALLVARYALPAQETRFRFANLLLLSLAGLDGIVLVRDLLGLYVFLEITAVSSFVLIALEKGKAAFEGAFKYLVLSAVATSMILAGLALLFMIAGSTSFDAVGSALRSVSESRRALPGAALTLFVAGLAVKAGLVPFHGWLPDAYSSAPAPVSVLLAGIVTKTTGIYTLIRLLAGDGSPGSAPFGSPQFILLLGKFLLVAGLVSIVVGALAALGQKDFKRMLAYSSISQMGYMVLALGAACVAPVPAVASLAVTAAVFHFFNHAVFKSLLFVNSAAVERQSGTRDMDRLGGISARMPVTGLTSVLAMLSTAGIPPLAGFWSKLLVIVAVWKAGWPGFASAAVLASILTLAYFLSMQRRVFFGKLSESCGALQEANGWNLVPALLLAGITVGVGLAAPFVLSGKGLL